MLFRYRSRCGSGDEPLIRVERIEKRYAGASALRPISFDLRLGDQLVVSGSSGSGKSTLLRILVGTTGASRGRVAFSGEMRALRCPYVPQRGGLIEDLTVAENLTLWAGLHTPRRQLRIEDRSLFARLGLNDRLGLLARELSGGYRKIASMACAFASLPHGLFLDEPYSGLDEEKAGLLRGEIQRLAPLLRILVVVSHSPADLPTANKHVQLRDGRMVSE